MICDLCALTNPTFPPHTAEYPLRFRHTQSRPTTIPPRTARPIPPRTSETHCDSPTHSQTHYDSATHSQTHYDSPTHSETRQHIVPTSLALSWVPSGPLCFGPAARGCEEGGRVASS